VPGSCGGSYHTDRDLDSPACGAGRPGQCSSSVSRQSRTGKETALAPIIPGS